MNDECIKTIKDLIEHFDFKCSVKSFSKYVRYWRNISVYRFLSESFIRKFHKKLNWLYMSV